MSIDAVPWHHDAEALARYPADATVVCEPHLSRLAAALLHADGRIAIGLAKSGVVGLEAPHVP